MSTLTVGSPVCEEWPVPAELGRAAARTKPAADVLRPALTRRRPNREQGIALEKLGHAIEYLIDSSMARCEGLSTDARSPEFEAVRIMMRLNCEIFGDCKPVVPIHERICRALGFRRQQMVGSVEHELHN
ncbi:MAG: hypothetical protein P4L10_10385 [Acidobacteriaceae bacterium]|nr:hypothetical protein [Acidobacteriaceae bacterium]